MLCRIKIRTSARKSRHGAHPEPYERACCANSRHARLASAASAAGDFEARPRVRATLRDTCSAESSGRRAGSTWPLLQHSAEASRGAPASTSRSPPVLCRIKIRTNARKSRYGAHPEPYERACSANSRRTRLASAASAAGGFEARPRVRATLRDTCSAESSGRHPAPSSLLLENTCNRTSPRTSSRA